MQTLIIVDDEKDLTWSLARGLSKTFPDWQILTANSVQDARKLLESTHVVILITDFRMPDGDGLDLILSAKKNHPGLLSILMTAYGSADLIQSLLRYPDILYLEKPFEIDDLRNILVKWMRRKENRQNTLQSLQTSNNVSGLIFS